MAAQGRVAESHEVVLEVSGIIGAADASAANGKRHKRHDARPDPLTAGQTIRIDKEDVLNILRPAGVVSSASILSTLAEPTGSFSTMGGGR
jgi:hypothetical protein